MFLRNLLMAGAGAALMLALPTGADAQTGATVTTDLNLRIGPGTAHAQVTVMPAGAAVTIHQCSAGWCQVSYANRTGWASQRYLDMRVATAPVQRAAPTVGFAFRAGTPPRAHWRDRHRPARFHGWHQRHWWQGRPAGWYGPVYWDRNRWWYGDRWHASPRFALQIGAGW